MNRFGKFGSIAVICIVVGALLVGASWLLNKKDFNNYDTTGYNYEEKTYVCENAVKSLVVNETSNDVSVEVVPGIDKVKVTYFVYEGKLEYEIGEKNGTLTVNRKSIKANLGGFGISLSSPYVKVEVPEGSYENVSAVCSSGRVSVEGIECDNLKAVATSGSVKLQDIVAKSINCGTTSGGVSLENVKADSTDAEATSGSIHLKNVKADRYNGGTTSGTNVLENVEVRKCNVSATSGEVRLENLASEDINIGATSGSVKGTIDGSEADYAIATKTTSGSSNMNDKTNGKYSVNISTTSGSIKVSFNK